MQENIFNKNLKALSNKDLKEKLTNFKQNNFKIKQGSDPLDINFIHHKREQALYNNTLDELNEKINLYNDKYLLYPILYFFGFGNGILYKILLQNKNRQKIVIFEKEIEFIYLSFHLLDFSEELKDCRLIILDINNINYTHFQILCNSSPFFNFLRTYFLDIHCDYYEKFHNDILKTNETMQTYIKKSILKFGNSSKDALKGIENFIYNLPDLFLNHSFKELLSKRKKTYQNAIIVSTGPSLIKQLPLLKKYTNKATIFCADSAYPILAKHNIKPDYVLSLERIEKTSEFFNNNFGDFDKDILFILTEIVYKNTPKYLKENNRDFIFIQKIGDFSKLFHLKDLGSLINTPSVANMAYFIASCLQHKNIILIGQDLAYSDDGFSHPQDYHYKADCESHYEHIQTLGYGGNSMVKTHEIWMVFKHYLEEAIADNKKQNIQTYNATEGGARIEGTIEKPFKELCESLFENTTPKSFIQLDKITQNKKNELMLKTFYKTQQAIKLCEFLHKENLYMLNRICFLMSDEKNFISLIQEIENYKIKLIKVDILKELTSAISVQFELNLARIQVLNPKTQEDNFNKMLLWIKEYLSFIEIINEHIIALKITLETNILNLENFLIKNNFEKYVNKIKATKLQSC
ncbi:TPA: motility associated factor glycosyltransferase family protein [Campylobacter lari]|nr:motility associated factor glycosyltransferase family protein [Campylobacter lari]